MSASIGISGVQLAVLGQIDDYHREGFWMKVGDLSGSNSIDLRARGVHIVIARQSLETKFSKETCEKRKSKICLAKAAPVEQPANQQNTRNGGQERMYGEEVKSKVWMGMVGCGP